MSAIAKKENIIDFMEKNSYLILDDEETLSYSTRQNAMGQENHSMKDMEEARKVVNILRKKYKNFTYEIDTCDEWVFLNITLK